jgi:hypothetical protein
MVPCAYLRVFEPLDAFPQPDRERWGRYVASGATLSTSAAARTEARLATSRLITGREPAPTVDALVRRVGRRVHICPLQVAERHAVALLAFRERLPDVAAEAFVSPREAHSALVAVEQLRRPPHIQASSWEVPLRWFVAFGPEERHFVDPPEATGPRLTYLTSVASALDRLDRVVDAVETNIQDGDPIVDALGDLVEWLAHFADDSILELDYGGLTSVIPSVELAIDHSCDDLWAVVEGLERGDALSAINGYETVAMRWQVLRERHRMN